MNKQSGNEVKRSYDPTGSGIGDEIAKPESPQPPTRDLTPEEKERADRVLGNFERGSSDQSNTTKSS